MNQATILWGDSVINYTIKYSDRKTLGIMVKPNCTVEVKAPFNTDLQIISNKVLKRAMWIIKQQKYFSSFGDAIPQRKYISGESHYYLGRQYLLRVEIGKPNSIKYKGRYFEVICSTKSKAKDLMKGWYRERAKIKFAEIAEPIISRFERYGVKPSSIYIQEMNNRWGSCTLAGKVILNTDLIKMPKPCIEYVITHELCHLIHRNHTKAFFELLESEMPDWIRWKEKLERFSF